MSNIDFIVEYFWFRFSEEARLIQFIQKYYAKSQSVFLNMPDNYTYFKEEIHESLTDVYLTDLTTCLYDLKKNDKFNWHPSSFKKTIFWIKDALGDKETEILFNILKKYFPNNTEIQFYPTYINLLNQLEFNFEEQI